MLDWSDPIVAIASPSGSGSRGIIRLCGDGVHKIVRSRLSDGTERVPPLPWQRQAWFRVRFEISLVRRAVPIDVYTWPQDRSSTGLPTVELHFPFTGALLGSAVGDLMESGVRQAKPGEFTLRAFLAGRLDLIQAEGVLGLIQSEDLVTLRRAIDWRTGGASKPLAEVRDSLLNLLADVEAGLDFVEEDISFTTREEIVRELTKARESIRSISNKLGSRGHDDPVSRVVLVGPPNVGKSSLFNALLGLERAIVHDSVGTTRDVIESEIQWDGLRIRLVDTAGMEDSLNAIMRQAEERREEVIRSADLVVWCSPTTHSSLPEGDSLAGSTLLRVRTKSDLGDSKEGAECAVSIYDSTSIERCRAEIARRLREKGHSDVSPLPVTDRLRECLANSLKTLEAMLKSRSEDEEVMAADLRDLLHHLGEALGHVHTEDLLDRVFSRFCIGK